MSKVKVVEVRNPPPPPAPPPIVVDPDADYEGWWDRQPEPEQIPEYLREMLSNMANTGMIEVKPQLKALPLPKEKTGEPGAEGSDQSSGNDSGVTVCNPEGYL